MSSAGLPDFMRHSRAAFVAALLLTLLVAVIEVPTVVRPPMQAPVQAIAAAA